MTFATGQRAIVADASVAVRMLAGSPDEVRTWREWLVEGAMIIAPAHFGHEVANALLRSVRLGEAATIAALEQLARLGVEVADRGFVGLAASVRLAERHGLTVYDAAYLDLAIDVDGELATLDIALRAAATEEGVPLAA